MTKANILIGMMMGLVLVFGSGCVSFAETPGERFRKAIKEIEAACAKRKLDPNEVCGGVAKLKPADPLATEEGRFAHSIKIPNPVPEDSGYRSGMTPEQYFDHLCKTEAGEFIYKTVENIDGIYMMRPRERVFDDHMQSLYALEDVYGYEDWEASDPGGIFVGPDRYTFIEMPVVNRGEPEGRREYVHPSLMEKPPSDAKVQRYFGYDGRNQKTLQKEYVDNRSSHYGYTWRGIQRANDRELGIAGGEIIVLDLKTNEILAVKRGFLRTGGVRNLTGIWWLRGQVCRNDPGRTKLTHTADFVSKVLQPSSITSKEKDHATK